MDRRVGLVLLTGVALTLLLVSVSTAGEVELWHPSTATDANQPGSSGAVTTETFPPRAGASESSRADLPNWIGVAVQVFILLSTILLGVWGVTVTWRKRPELRWRKPVAPDDDFDVLPDIARSMSADAADQRAALLRGTPRNAIVECWLRLESVVAGAGMPRDPADTSTEFTSRVLESFSIDRTSILELSALYREARFSTHQMGEVERGRAVEALDVLHAELSAYLSRDAVVRA